MRDHGGTTTPEGQVAVEALRKILGRAVAVDDVSLTAEPAEFLGPLGASGSGRATILMALAGFQHPISGRVTLNGKAA